MGRFINLSASNMKIVDFFFVFVLRLCHYRLNTCISFYFILTQPALRLIEILRDVQCKIIFNLIVQLIDFAYVSCNIG